MTDFNTPIYPKNEETENEIDFIQQEKEKRIAELEKERELKSKQNNLNFYTLCGLVLFGAFGAFYCMSTTGFQCKTKMGIHPLTSNKSTATQINFQKERPTKLEITPYQNQLIVNDRYQDEDEMVLFEIARFNSKAKYHLHVNGKKVMNIQSKKFHYTFRDAGTYNVTLHIQYGEEHAVLDTINLNILAAIEEAENARLVDF